MRLIYIHAGFGIGPHNSTPFDANAFRYTRHSIFQRQLPCEEGKERSKADDAGLFEWAFTIANELLPHIEMFSSHTHMANIYVRAADIHILQMRPCSFGVRKSFFHRFAWAYTII